MFEDLNKEEHTHANNELLQDVIGLSDDDIQDVTQSISVNQAKNNTRVTHFESQRVRKRSRGENILANSMDKFANKLVEVVGKSAERMSDVAESVRSMAEGVKVAKSFYDDSRAVADALVKMDGLTHEEQDKAGRLLMHDLPLVHLFWDFQGERRVQFVKNLLKDN